MSVASRDGLTVLVRVWTSGAAISTVVLVFAGGLALVGALDLSALDRVGPALLETFLVLGVAGLLAVPLAASTAVGLDQVLPQGPVVRGLSRVLHAAEGIPSVIVGVVAATWVGLGAGIVVSGAVLGVWMVPSLVGEYRRALGAVKERERLAALALGATPLQVLVYVVGPAASRPLGAATLRGLARSAGLAAPLIVCAAGTTEPLAVVAVRAAAAGEVGVAATLAVALMGLVLGLRLLASAVDVDRSWRTR